MTPFNKNDQKPTIRNVTIKDGRELYMNFTYQPMSTGDVRIDLQIRLKQR